MIGRLGDTVCDPHHTCGGDEKREFPGLASKPVVMVYQCLASKPLQQFFGLGFKIKVDGLVVWPQNHSYGLVIWASKLP
jgi:hypothetical protein